MRDPTPWLTYLNKLEAEGFHEEPGPESNPKILEWSHGPGQYPQMDDDSTTPWCGIGLAGVFHDIKMDSAIPKHPAAAISWLNCGPSTQIKIGAVAVLPRVGGNHVTVVKEIRGEEFLGIGCNQSNAIKTSRFRVDEARGYRWPAGAVTKQVDVPVVRNEYSDLLQRMQVKPEWQSRIDAAARKIVRYRAKYKEVEEVTGVPWAFIGVLHMRESDNDFTTHLHNGDPLSDRTENVPAGRPTEGDPPFTWVESAIDALDYDGFIDKDDWTLENICDRAERYNGLGYKRMGIPSPYLWSGTNNYQRGKYISDGEFSANTVDKQLGVIPVYLRTMDLAHETTVREGSRKLTILSWAKTALKALITIVGGLFTGDTWGLFKDYFSVVNGVFDTKTMVTIALTGGATWVLINWLDKLMMEDAKTGTWVPSSTASTNNIPLYDPEDDAPKPKTKKKAAPKKKAKKRAKKKVTKHVVEPTPDAGTVDNVV